ncbi:uncharacterized protein [Agelaius tricolor]|uniref:uncharacterized protein n=1 Tax=Agelaius tricolor TaxID=9191 RepID=UPI0039F1AF43
MSATTPRLGSCGPSVAFRNTAWAANRAHLVSKTPYCTGSKREHATRRRSPNRGKRRKSPGSQANTTRPWAPRSTGRAKGAHPATLQAGSVHKFDEEVPWPQAPTGLPLAVSTGALKVNTPAPCRVTAPAGGAPADAGTVPARKSGAGRDETGVGPPAPDTGEGRDAKRDAVRAAASLRDGTREPGKPPMRVRPKPQDCPVGTAPTEQRGMGCPPTGAGPDRTPTDAPPPAASTDCARSAGCAGPGTGEVAPPPADEPGSEVGDPAPAVARGNFVETPQFGHQVVTEPDSSRGGGWPSRTGKAQRKGNPSPTPPPTPGEAGRGQPAESTEPAETHGAPPPSTPSGGGEGDSTSDKNSNSPSSTSEAEELPQELQGVQEPDPSQSSTHLFHCTSSGPASRVQSSRRASMRRVLTRDHSSLENTFSGPERNPRSRAHRNNLSKSSQETEICFHSRTPLQRSKRRRSSSKPTALAITPRTAGKAPKRGGENLTAICCNTHVRVTRCRYRTQKNTRSHRSQGEREKKGHLFSDTNIYSFPKVTVDWRVTVAPLQCHWLNQQSINSLLLHKGMQNNELFTESV